MREHDAIVVVRRTECARYDDRGDAATDVDRFDQLEAGSGRGRPRGVVVSRGDFAEHLPGGASGGHARASRAGFQVAVDHGSHDHRGRSRRGRCRTGGQRLDRNRGRFGYPRVQPPHLLPPARLAPAEAIAIV